MLDFNTAPLPNASGDDETKDWLAARLERGRREVFVDVDTITPERARALLARNESNRRIVQGGLARWTRALRTGAWQLNGETIKVSSCGKLNDGQHRLLAIINTGIAASTVIVWGLARESRDTVDTGARRTAAHVIGMRVGGNASLAAAATRIIMNYDDGLSLATARENQEIADAHDRLVDFDASKSAGMAAYRIIHITPSLLVAMHYICARRDRAKADAFFAALASGTADAKSPVTILRNRLIQDMTSKARLPMIEIAALIIKAFNAYRTGQHLTSLRWRRDGSAPEAFPRVI